LKKFTDFTKFTLERVPPLLRDLRDVLAFIVVLILAITAFLAIPIGIVAGGSYLAYKAGLPYNIPLAIGTAALTVIWYFVLAAWFQWISDSGETWRADKSARENQEIQEEATEAT
jgi:fatty acid desaturase